MVKLKLSNGTMVDSNGVGLVNGALVVSVNGEQTVEELEELFSNKENTNKIEILDESGEVVRHYTGFTILSEIKSSEIDKSKKVELFKPLNAIETKMLDKKTTELEEIINTFLGTTEGV